MKKTLLLTLLYGIFGYSIAQTQFWADDFESATAPSSGTRITTNNSGSGNTYFRRATNSDIDVITLSDGNYSNFQGSYFWAGEDPDEAFGGEQQIIWTVDISGKTDISFKGLFGAQGTNNRFESTVAGHIQTDYIIVEYAIDGGAYAPLISFYVKSNTEKNLYEDTDGDLLGDGVQLTKSMSEFTKSISGSGNVLKFRLRAYSNGSGEEFAFDNFRLSAAAACTMTASITSQKNVECNGTSTGSLTVTQSNGTGNFNYAWNNGSTTSNTSSSTNSIAFLGANNYSVTVTDKNGCTATASATITQPLALTATTSKATPTCKDGSNGSASVSPSGGTAPYTYSWSPSGGNSATATGLSAGTYTCTITDDNGCTIDKEVTLTNPTGISGAKSQSNVSCNGGSDGTAFANVGGGTAPYAYSWSPSGGNAAPANGLSAGVYTVTVTDDNGCTQDFDFTITEPTAITTTTSKTDISCNGGSDGTATVITSGGIAPYSYSWSPSGRNSATATGLSARTYTCTITDGNGCTTDEEVTITEPTKFSSRSSKTDVTCKGGSDGIATVSPFGGTPPYSYSWSPFGGSEATASGLSAGAYRCTLADDNGCPLNFFFTITEPTTALTATTSKANPTCKDGSNGTATVTTSGGAAPYTYSWSPSGGNKATATGLSSGTYTCTITDDNGCTIDKEVTLTNPAGISGAKSQSNVSCNGGSDGTAFANVGGGTAPYAYSWSPSGGNAAPANGLSAGIYTVTVTDDNGCTQDFDFTITEPTSITTTTSKTDITCNGGSDGTATVTASGGIAPYTYSWSPSGGNSATATGLSAGTYTCTITDGNGCTTDEEVTITEPILIKVTETIAVCDSYKWTDGNTYTSSGIYTQKLTNKMGCDSLAELDLTIHPAIEVTFTNSDNVLSAQGDAISFQWYNCDTETNITDATEATFTVADLGMYAVIGTSIDGCIDTSDCATIDPTLGFNSFNKNEELKLFPNPASNRLEIHFPGNTASVEIYNSNGAQQIQLNNFNSGNELLLEGLESGIYHIKITTETNTWNKSILKQ